jgi:hypothetical protein
MCSQCTVVFGKIIVFEVILINILDILFGIDDATDIRYLWIVFEFLVVSIIIVTNYYLSKRYLQLNMILGQVQTLVVTIGIVEKALMFHPTLESTDIFIILLAITASFSIICIN